MRMSGNVGDYRGVLGCFLEPPMETRRPAAASTGPVVAHVGHRGTVAGSGGVRDFA
jgi:hypothetical protein